MVGLEGGAGHRVGASEMLRQVPSVDSGRLWGLVGPNWRNF